MRFLVGEQARQSPNVFWTDGSSLIQAGCLQGCDPQVATAAGLLLLALCPSPSMATRAAHPVSADCHGLESKTSKSVMSQPLAGSSGARIAGSKGNRQGCHTARHPKLPYPVPEPHRGPVLPLKSVVWAVQDLHQELLCA